jgi:hypothetical protein
MFIGIIWNVDAQMEIKDYQNKKFKLDTLKLDNDVQLIIARHADKIQGEENLIWLLMNGKTDFINSTTSETGVYVPNPQPLKGQTMIVSCSEYDGTIMIVEGNNLFKIQGYIFGLNQSKQAMFTKCRYDGDYLASRFDLKTKKTITKQRNNSKGDPWESQVTYYEVKNTDWIK